MAGDRHTGIRESIELEQPYSHWVMFTHILSGDDSETIIDTTIHMTEVNRISLVADREDIFIRLVDREDDESVVAERTTSTVNSVTSFMMLENSGYFDENTRFEGRIEAIRANEGSNTIPSDGYGRIRGILWGRR